MLRKALFVIRQSRTQPLAVRSILDIITAQPGKPQTRLSGLAILDVEALREQMAQKILGHTMSYSPDLPEAERTVREEFALLLSEFSDSCSAAGVAHQARLVEGRLTAVLKSEAERNDLLVVPRDTGEGEDKVRLFLNPRLFPEVISRCPVPVLLGPLLPSMAGLAPPVPVVAAYDGSEGAIRALHSAATLGLLDGRDVEVVSIAGDEGAARACAETAASLAADHGGRPRPVPFAASRHPADILLDHIGHRPALLVMGAFGTRSIKELLFGSVTERIIASCPCPILLQR